ncbi:hypothetical protein J4Q44_G00145760 [Coregonus suidteri]|uniref:Uncharacterized protein n=1 Tax=Coregonus suidteri TaxID=861788 RepID=A0AAN8LS76_9TELE
MNSLWLGGSEQVYASGYSQRQFSVLMKLCYDLRAGIAVQHAKVKPLKKGVLNMLKRLDKIRFRGQKRDDFLDLAESPNGSDNECSDDILLRTRPSLKTQDTEELGDPVSIHYTSLCSLSQMRDHE